jgi:uncharacterized damage-inducible protein DinB
MRIVDSIIGELDQEAATTRRVLERVPNERLGWKPHTKSMTLGELALHVATTPAEISEFLLKTTFELPDFGAQPTTASNAELLAAHDKSVAQAKTRLRDFDDAALMETWSLTKGGKTLFSAPRIGVIRAILLNHWYHHRGQLSVYLRLLDVPVPSIYGPSADENPFG